LRHIIAGRHLRGLQHLLQTPRPHRTRIDPDGVFIRPGDEILKVAHACTLLRRNARKLPFYHSFPGPAEPILQLHFHVIDARREYIVLIRIIPRKKVLVCHF
jgi:hypothetical protein